MATNGAPDNWEDEDMDVSNKLSALNVNAATFVPNPNAAVFVPSWGPEAAAPKSENKDNGKMAVDEPSPVEAVPPPPADSWEESRPCLADRSSHTWIPGPLEGWSMSRRGLADTGHQPPPAAVLKQSSGRHSFFKISMRMRTDFGDLGWTKTNKNGN